MNPEAGHCRLEGLAGLRYSIMEARKEEAMGIDKRRVFVIHGRDIKLRDSLFDFLGSIGLSPIEWSQAIAATKKGTPDISQILDSAFNEAQALVVLLTGDDIAQLHQEFLHKNDPFYERELTLQARANVLFEAGMAMGRYPERTVLVQIGKLRPWSDIGGKHITYLDNSVEKRQELVIKLKNVGCEVDISGQRWFKVGDFTYDRPPSIEISSSLMFNSVEAFCADGKVYDQSESIISQPLTFDEKVIKEVSLYRATAKSSVDLSNKQVTRIDACLANIQRLVLSGSTVNLVDVSEAEIGELDLSNAKIIHLDASRSKIGRLIKRGARIVIEDRWKAHIQSEVQ